MQVSVGLTPLYFLKLARICYSSRQNGATTTLHI
jgi:hypothetical protein